MGFHPARNPPFWGSCSQLDLVTSIQSLLGTGDAILLQLNLCIIKTQLLK